MKKTYQANIDGQIFNIDDDAFELLNNYLEQLHLTFPGNDGKEIVADIESRIRELLTEHISTGANIISIEDVKNVIQRMGWPQELGNETTSSTCDDSTEGSQKNNGSEHPPFISFNLPGKKRLFRNMRNKVFGGVFGGIATYLGWDANVMRILYVLLTFFTYLWPMTIIYLLLWMIIPAAKTPSQILEMTGEPVNLNSVGQVVMATNPVSSDQGSGDGNFFVAILTIIGKTLMGILGLIAGVISFACLVALFCIISGSISFAFFSYPKILDGLNMLPPDTCWAQIWGGASILAGIFAIFGLMAFGAFAVVLNQKGASKPVVATTLIISTMLFAIAAVLLIFFV